MLTSEQIKEIRMLRLSGRKVKTIASMIDMPEAEIRKVIQLPYTQVVMRNILYCKSVVKIKDEYLLLLENGFNHDYAVNELSKLHSLEKVHVERLLNWIYIVDRDSEQRV